MVEVSKQDHSICGVTKKVNILIYAVLNQQTPSRYVPRFEGLRDVSRIPHTKAILSRLCSAGLSPHSESEDLIYIQCKIYVKDRRLSHHLHLPACMY